MSFNLAFLSRCGMPAHLAQRIAGLRCSRRWGNLRASTADFSCLPVIWKTCLFGIPTRIKLQNNESDCTRARAWSKSTPGSYFRAFGSSRDVRIRFGRLRHWSADFGCPCNSTWIQLFFFVCFFWFVVYRFGQFALCSPRGAHVPTKDSQMTVDLN